MGSRTNRWLLALLLLAPGCATAPVPPPAPPPPRPALVTVRGTLRLTPPDPRAPAPPIASHGHAPRAETPADAVVYIEEVPTAPVAAAAPAVPVTPVQATAKDPASAAARSTEAPSSRPGKSAPPAGGARSPASSAPRLRDAAVEPAKSAAEERSSRKKIVPEPASATAIGPTGATGAVQGPEPAPAASSARPSSRKPSRAAPRPLDRATASAEGGLSEPEADPGVNGAEGARTAAPGARSRPSASRSAATPATSSARGAGAPATAAPVAPADSAPRPVIGQVDHQFVPRVLPVVVGTTVDFENRDRVYHNVFSISPAKRFDLGKYAPRHRRSVTFDKAGVVQLYCDIDPVMAGFVFVAPHAWYAQPDAAGAFRLPPLPPGSYTLKVWHPTRGRSSMRLHLAAPGERSVELQL